MKWNHDIDVRPSRLRRPRVVITPDWTQPQDPVAYSVQHDPCVEITVTQAKWEEIDRVMSAWSHDMRHPTVAAAWEQFEMVRRLCCGQP
jgi:hypothetical protein